MYKARWDEIGWTEIASALPTRAQQNGIGTIGRHASLPFAYHDAASRIRGVWCAVARVDVFNVSGPSPLFPTAG